MEESRAQLGIRSSTSNLDVTDDKINHLKVTIKKISKEFS